MQLSEREHLTKYISDVGSLRTVKQVENLWKGKMKEITLKRIFKKQILF